MRAEFGPDEKARLIALSKANGEIVWEALPPKVDESEQQMPERTGGRGFGPGCSSVRKSLQPIRMATRSEARRVRYSGGYLVRQVDPEKMANSATAVIETSRSDLPPPASASWRGPPGEDARPAWLGAVLVGPLHWARIICLRLTETTDAERRS